MDYFLIKDSVTNGSAHKGLNGIMQLLIKTKPVKFFEQGYLSDIFIHDRLDIEQATDRKAVIVRCKKNYLSTYILGKQGNPEDDKHFDFFKVA